MFTTSLLSYMMLSKSVIQMMKSHILSGISSSLMLWVRPLLFSHEMNDVSEKSCEDSKSIYHSTVWFHQLLFLCLLCLVWLSIILQKKTATLAIIYLVCYIKTQELWAELALQEKFVWWSLAGGFISSFCITIRLHRYP